MTTYPKISPDFVPHRPRPKVTVCVVTYNQKDFIAQCLQSLVDQVTDFPFEILVGDDCSTDGTSEIVENFANIYPALVYFFRHNKNVGPFENYRSVHAKAAGEYVAHLDGDDFSLPEKLQKQSDYLDEHNECSAVVHKLKIQDLNKIPTGQSWPSEFTSSIFNLDELVKKHPAFGHSSIMYRRGCVDDIPKNESFIDFYIYVLILKSGQIGVMGESLGVYTQGVGISSKSNLIEPVERALELAGHLGASESLISLSKARQYLLFSKKSLLSQNYVEFKSLIAKSLACKVFSLQQVNLWLLRSFPKLILLTYKAIKHLK